MKRPVFLLGLLAAAAAQMLPARSMAQGAIRDFIIQVGDEEFETTAQFVWVNKNQCDGAATVDLEVSLGGTDPITEIFVWVGGEAANCETRESRVGANPTCSQVGNGSILVEQNRIVSVKLSDLIGSDNGRVDCESSALQGTNYQLFNFRTNPGDNDVPPTEYGTAPFTVDVEPPQAVSVDTEGPLTGSQFTISWERPTESTFLEEYRFYQSPEDDTATATLIPDVSANGTANSVTLSANQLGLDVGDSEFVFVQAVDMALNEGDLSSPGVEVIAVESGGFCDATGECGCAATRMSPNTAGTLWGSMGFFLLTIALLRRRFIR